MKTGKLLNHKVKWDKIEKLIFSFFILFILVINFNARSQSHIHDYAVFGGAQNCVGPGQTPPATLIGITPGCGVHMGVGSVINGNVGSYHIVEANGSVTINGNIYSGGIVNLANSNIVDSITAADGDNRGGNIISTGSGAKIYGSLDANGNIFVNSNGSSFVNGTVTHTNAFTYLGPLPGGGEIIGAPALPVLPVMPAITALTCPTGSVDNVTATRTIGPGSYGNMILGNAGGTITFDGPGDYYFNVIDIAQGPTKKFIYDFHGSAATEKINIYICGDVDLGKLNAEIVNGTGSKDDACRIYFETHGDGSSSADGTFSFIIGTGSNFLGTVWAPYAAIHVGSGSCCTYVTGHLWSATQVDVQHGVTITACEMPCHACLKISKRVSFPQCGTDSINADAPADSLWHFRLTGPNSFDTLFTLPFDVSKVVEAFFCDLAAGDYTIFEDTAFAPGAHGWDVFVNGVRGTSAIVNLSDCETDSVAFENSAKCRRKPPEGCSWCNKSAVRSQVWQNFNGDTCAVPDILVDVRLPHNAANDTVTANEIHTGIPATWSIQEAIDYVNAYGDPTPGDGGIFIGVTASDCGTVPTCKNDSSRNPGGDTPYGTENVIVTNNWTTRLNIFGCSVTVWAADVTKPVFTVNNAAGKGKITILDLHAKGSLVAGYSINNKGDLVIVKNSRAMNNDIGYKVLNTSTSNVEITGSPEISNNRIGISLEGTKTLLRSNNHIDNNTQYGIVIIGTANNSNGSGVQKNGAGMLISGNNNTLSPGGDDISFNTGIGITITGNGNKLYDEDVLSNGSHGIAISGNSNLLEKCKHIEKNAGHGIYVGRLNGVGSPSGNKLTENVCTSNGKDGINANTGNFATTTNLTKNQGNKNVGYGIRPCGQTNGLNNTASGNGNNTITFVGCSLRMASESGDDDMTGLSLNAITRIYPNPTLGMATISFNSISTDKFTLKVVDMIGRVVISEVLVTTIGENTHEIDLSTMAKGVYTVVLENGGFKDHRTIIVK